MKSLLKYFLIWLLATFSTSTLFGQNSSTFLKSGYDPDPVLYNGMRYTYFPPLRTGGHQYLVSEKFAQGSIRLRGNFYENLQLNYDIYSQFLVLRFTNPLGAIDQLIVSDAWLEGFTIGEMTFEYVQWSDSSWKIAQVIGKDNYEILILWHKNLSLDTRFGATNHVFSKPQKRIYLRHENAIKPFKNKRQFIKLFPEDFESQLKRYLRKQHFSFKKATDQEIYNLLEYCALNLKQE